MEGIKVEMETRWNLDKSYANLPKSFFTKQNPTPVCSPELIILNNSLAKSANQENLKIWAQTYVSPKMNLELEYNNRETLKGAKTVDYSAMSVSLNHSF